MKVFILLLILISGLMKDKKRILFVTSAAPEKSPFSTSEKRPPLGLGFLISVVRDSGHEVFFIDNYLKYTDFVGEGFLIENKIDIVGIYSNTICFESTKKILNDLHKLRSENKWKGIIAVGGPHVSVAIKTIPDFVDYVVYGEGEKAILEILSEEAETRIIRSFPIKDLDKLPFQPWDIFTRLDYDFTSKWIDVKPVFTMNTSRGCPFDCSFCSVGSIWGRRYTFFSAERIIDEIIFLKKNYGAKAIYFREDNFTLNIKRVEKFCNLIITKKIKILWACETRVDNLSKELLKLMSDAGCRALYLGVESGSKKVLKSLNKQINVTQVKNVILWGKEFNINSYCSLITGVPGENIFDLIKTYRMIKKLNPYSYAFNIFVGLPGSPIYNEILKNKLYEYIDDLGLVYMPGFDIKTRFFYGSDSSAFVDYIFRKREVFDRILQFLMFIKKVKIKLFSMLGK